MPPDYHQMMKSAKLRPRVFLGALAALGGCILPSDPLDLGPVPAGAFTTDASGYRAVEVGKYYNESIYGFTVVTRYENRGMAALYLSRCLPSSRIPVYAIVASDSGSDGSAYSQAWACVETSRIEVLPGATRTDTISIQGPGEFDGTTHKSLGGKLDGRCRLRYFVSTSDGKEAPFAQSYSNEFIIRVDR